MQTVQAFVRRRDFLICVDSDGCAMDTMNSKHFRCFGPCMVTEWALQAWQEPVLKLWNDINLYTVTRGINRFAGLALALQTIHAQYARIDGLDELCAWTKTSPELSNAALAAAVETASGPCLAKALAWSNAVNTAIQALPEADKRPFAGAAAGLAAAHERADVAVVSSANRRAVEEEWQRCGLLPSVDVLCCQDTGSKAACIAALRQKGYAPGHILMVGDAPGDLAAAEKNGAFFYPILVRREEASWREFTARFLGCFFAGRYAECQPLLKDAFYTNLGAKL